MLKHKAAGSLLEEENYKDLRRDRGMVERNPQRTKAQAWAFRQLPSYAHFFYESLHLKRNMES